MLAFLDPLLSIASAIVEIHYPSGLADMMVQMPNIQRAKRLLDSLRCLWRDPGVSDAQRQRLVLEVLDQVKIRGKEIVTMRPKAQYELHFAYMALANGGCPESGRQELNLRPPAPHAGALPNCATPRPQLEYHRDFGRSRTHATSQETSILKGSA